MSAWLGLIGVAGNDVTGTGNSHHHNSSPKEAHSSSGAPYEKEATLQTHSLGAEPGRLQLAELISATRQQLGGRAATVEAQLLQGGEEGLTDAQLKR